MRAAIGIRNHRSGFTVIELTITVLIISIMAAVAAPRYFEATNRFRAAAAAKRIAADLNLARENANSKGGVGSGEWVSFYTGSDNYKLHNDPDIDRPEDEYWIYLAKTAYPVDLVLVQFTNIYGYTSNTTVKYDMYGRANSGSSPTAPLTVGQVVVQAGSEQRTVVISPTTGKASVP